MVRSNENNVSLAKPTINRGGVEMRHNRRALGVINQKIVGGEQYPCVVNKRTLSERNGACEKNPPVPLHRPVTRKLAAQIANGEEAKKPKIIIAADNDFTVWEDVPLEEEQEEQEEQEEHKENVEKINNNEALKDHPVPMSLDHSSDEKDQMEEVEMEDIFEESVMDIDSSDAKNPLAAVEYVEDLYAFYKKMENSGCVSPNYMEEQFDINEKMRAILIDWLIEVHYKFELREETLFLTVNLIDRFLAKQNVERKKLQLVGLVAMLLACKYEEVSVPIVDDLVFISDKAYTRKQVLDMERLMLNTLQFNMTVPTGYVFLTRFLKAAQSDKKLELLSFFLMELCLVEYEMLKFPPSFLAAAAIYTAQSALYGLPQWCKTSEYHSTYSEPQLLECARMIVGYHEKAATGKLTGVHRKYSTSRFGYAAKCEPSSFLLLQRTQQ